MVNISDAAAKEINRIKYSSKQPDSHLRITVKKGGCSGCFYDLSLESNHSHPIEQKDCHYQRGEISIVVDSSSEPHIKNLKLDYSEDLMGGGFRFQNPQATNVCSCGLSFLPKVSPD